MCWKVHFADSGLSNKYTMSVQNEFQELDPLWIKECPADQGTLYVDRVDIKSGIVTMYQENTRTLLAL